MNEETGVGRRRATKVERWAFVVIFSPRSFCFCLSFLFASRCVLVPIRQLYRARELHSGFPWKLIAPQQDTSPRCPSSVLRVAWKPTAFRRLPLCEQITTSRPLMPLSTSAVTLECSCSTSCLAPLRSGSGVIVIDLHWNLEYIKRQRKAFLRPVHAAAAAACEEFFVRHIVVVS